MAVDIVTFGCRLNAFEAEVMRREAEAVGLSDTIVINSCAVTNEAVAQARQSIRRLKRERPEARIVVTGCAAQTQSAMFADMAEVDRVVGNDDKMRREAWRAARDAFDLGTSEKIAVGDIMAVKQMAPHLIDGYASGLPRVFVQVQNGCDHRCTFCIIPYGRGASRSSPIGDVIAGAQRLVDAGHKEIVLTGVDMTSWGADLPGAPRFGGLVAALLDAVPDLYRLRLSSVDCAEIDPALFDCLTAEPRVAPYLHLSLQAGADLILKRMKRRHSRADAIALTKALRARRPGIAIGADFIAGFPTETDAHFDQTLALIDEAGVNFVHAFPFSRRDGAPAAKMPPVPAPVIAARAKALREKGAAATRAFLDTLIGRVEEAVVESGGRARLGNFASVRLAESNAAPGDIASVKIVARDGEMLIGETAAFGGGHEKAAPGPKSAARLL